MRSKRIPTEEQYRLIMECRQSGLTDHQWCVEHDIKPGTFYNWVKRLRQKGCVDLPASTGRSYRAPESQEVVRVDFHDTDPVSYTHLDVYKRQLLHQAHELFLHLQEYLRLF